MAIAAAELQKEFNELDPSILRTEGNARVGVTPISTKLAATKKKGVAVRKRAKNQRTAKEWAIEILGNAKGGLSLKELANQMLESGYKTTSTNFSVALYQVLYNARNKGETFDMDEKTGNWVLRK